MKKIITLSLALLTFGVYGQTDSTSNPSDTTKTEKNTEIDFGNVTVIVKDKKKYKVTKDSLGNENDDWDYEDEEDDYPSVDFETSFGIGMTGFQNVANDGAFISVAPDADEISTASLDLDYGQSRSYFINGNLLIDFTKNVGLLTGVGFEFNRFVFRENLQVNPETGAFMSDSVTNFSSYKFKTNYIQVPLMLKFQTNKQDFKFAVGGAVGYNINNKVLAEFSDLVADYESVVKADFNVAPFKVTLGARIAYKGIGLYFNYALTEMNGSSVNTANGRRNLMPFNAGITLGGL